MPRRPTRTPNRPRHVAPLAIAVLGTLALAPSLASAAPRTNAETVAEAKASPLFKREVRRAALQRNGLLKIQLQSGVEMDLREYVRATGLDAVPQTEPLFDPKLAPTWLSRAPTYSEQIIVLTDRIVVDRRLTVPLVAGACDDGAAPAAIRELCFVKDPRNKTDKDVVAELKKVRAGLKKSDAAREFKPGVSVKQALDLDDDALLGLLLNGDTKTIHHTSVIPRVATVGTTTDLGALDKSLERAKDDTGLVKQSTAIPGDVAQIPGNRDFGTQYFLTGFTYGREIEDAWEYTLAGETWLTDRYYVRLSYHLTFGFGVRAPFSVGVKSEGSGSSRRVAVKVAPVDVDEQGNPAYPATGLPANKTFDGKEFVLEFSAGCSFYASIPGPNVEKSCPSVSKSFSRDVDPVIGSESSAIADWWLDGSVTGLAINLAVVKASLDVGVGADITNGRISMRPVGTGGASTTGVANGRLTFANRDALSFDVTRGADASAPRLRLDEPRYGFDLRLRPKLRGKIDLDVGVYDRTWILGPYALDFLSISQNFQLSQHAGTVGHHDYAVFDTDVPVVMHDDPVSPPPKPPRPPKRPNRGNHSPDFPDVNVLE